MTEQFAKPLIHIGLHKTGTTWLQNFLFDNPKAGLCAPWGKMSALAIDHFIAIDPLQFDAHKAQIAFNPGLTEAAQHKLIPVLTHEALSSRPIHGAYYAPWVASRLRQTFPEGRVFLAIREQKSLLLSLYKQYIRRGGNYKLESFLGTGKEPIGWNPLCRLPFFEFDRLVELYHNEFGKENVLVLPMEMLRKNRDQFTHKIINFSGSKLTTLIDQPPSNVGWSGATLELYRRVNPLLPENPLSPVKPFTTRLAQRLFYQIDRFIPQTFHSRFDLSNKSFIENRVGDYFRTSNSRLSNLIGIDLGTFGYPTDK